MRLKARANKKKWDRTKKNFSDDEEEGLEEVRNTPTATQSDPSDPIYIPSAKETEENPVPVHVPSRKCRKRVATQSQHEPRRSKRKPIEDLGDNEPKSRSQPITRKAKKVVEDEQKGEGKHHSIAENRSNLLAIIRLIDDLKLKDIHMAAIKKTPFSLLVEVIKEKRLSIDSCRKYDDVVVKVIQSFNPSTKCFRLGNREVSLTRDDVKLIFGISCGEEEMKEMHMKKNAVGLSQRLKIQDRRLKSTALKTKITQLIDSENQQDIDDVARLLCLFICVTLLFSTKGTSVNWSYVYYMEDLNKVKKYDWAGAVVKYLMKSISTHCEDLKELKGCALLLQYWLCEHTKLIEEKDLDAANSIPRLLKWNTTKLRNKLKDVELSQLSKHQVHDELQMTIVERKMYAHQENDTESCERVGEMEGQGEDNEEKGLDDFGTATHFFDSVGSDPSEKVVESGSTTVPNTMPSMGTAPNTMDPSIRSKDELEIENKRLMAELSKKIENLEKEKHILEIENQRLRGDNEEKGLDDFGTPTHFFDSVGSDPPEKVVESGSTIVPNTMPSMGTAPNTMDPSIRSKDELEIENKRLMAEFSKKMEKLEKEKHSLEIENQRLRRENECQKSEMEALKNEIESVKGRNKDDYEDLMKKNELLEKAKVFLTQLNEKLEEQIDCHQAHDLTQEYYREEERLVHEVTQNATLDKLKRLEKETDELKRLLTDLIFHDLSQEEDPKKRYPSPGSRVERIKERDDRKPNEDLNFVYERKKFKRKKPQELEIDVDKYEVISQEANVKKVAEKLKALKPQSDMAIDPQIWEKIQAYWKEGNPSAVVWTVPNSSRYPIHIEVRDIENLLHSSAISNQCVDGYAQILMKPYMESTPTFDLGTPLDKSFIFISYFKNMIEGKKEKNVERILETIMPTTIPARYLLFPLLLDFHWTLLVLDKKEGKWKFYNSRKQRTKTDDEHCIATDRMRSIVADYINTRQKSENSVPYSVEIVENAPQQGKESLDCGIIVISIMKSYLMNQVQPSKISKRERKMMRAEIIHEFMKT